MASERESLLLTRPRALPQMNASLLFSIRFLIKQKSARGEGASESVALAITRQKVCLAQQFAGAEGNLYIFTHLEERSFW